MNPFTNLPGYDADVEVSEDIENEKQLRTTHKKIRRLKEKPIRTKEQASKLRIFESMVEEYENKGMKRKSENEPQKKKEKQKGNDDNKFLNQEYQKNKEFWKKEEEKKRKEREANERENEREEKERERRREERKREDKRHKREEKEREGKREEEERKNQENECLRHLIPELFSKYKIEEIPEDILDLYFDYDIKKYKNISCKYHPDKGKYPDDYQKIINEIKSTMN